MKAAKPTKVRSVRVKGKSSALKRTIRWKAPKWNGGAKVKSYKILIKQGRTKWVSKKVKASKRKFKVNTGLIALGKYQVTIRAKNSSGYGPSGKKKFKVSL